MQTRVRQIEVRHRRLPLRHMPMTVTVIRRQRVEFQGIVLQIKLQIVFLPFVEQRVLGLRLAQPCRDIIPRIRLDGGIGLNHPVRRQLLDEVIHLRVLNHLRNPLRRHTQRTKKQYGEKLTSHSEHLVLQSLRL